MVFDEVTGNFPGWQYVSLILGILLSLCAVLLFLSFMKAKKDRLFSYRTVGCLGLSFFLFILGVTWIIYFLIYGQNSTFYLTLVSISLAPVDFLIYTLPVTVLFSMALIVSNAELVHKEGFRPANLYAVGFGIVIVLAALFGFFLNRDSRALIFSNSFVLIYSGLFCYFECLFIAVTVCTVYAGVRNPGFGRDHIIILGCRVRSDGTLFPLARKRTDRALAYSDDQEKACGEKAVLVPSGGKGPDEPVSEAQAMKDYLLSRGFDESRIAIEDKSTTTRENMRFSRELIKNLGGGRRMLFSTSSYHVFRSGMLAKSEGLENIDGIGARTVWYFWPNAFVREFIGLLSESWKFHLAMIAAVSAFSLLLTALMSV